MGTAGLIPRAPESPLGDFPLRARRALQQLTDLINSLILGDVLVPTTGPGGSAGPGGPGWTLNPSLFPRSAGQPGPPGEDGEDGMSIPGPPGAAGASGAAGATGPAGPIGFGMDGQDGD